MTKISVYTLVAILLLAITAGGVYAVSPQQQAFIVANNTFEQGWSYLCVDSWKSLGFENETQGKNAYLGKQIWRVYQIDPQSYSPDKLLTEQIIERPLFLIPVMADGKVITDLEVALVDGDWKIASLGGHVCKKANLVLKENNLEQTDCKIVASPLQKYFIAVRDGKEVGVPYGGDEESAEMNISRINDLKETLMLNKMNYVNKNVNPELIGYGMPGVGFSNQKQTTSIFTRLARFVSFHLSVIS